MDRVVKDGGNIRRFVCASSNRARWPFGVFFMVGDEVRSEIGRFDSLYWAEVFCRAANEQMARDDAQEVKK